MRRRLLALLAICLASCAPMPGRDDDGLPLDYDPYESFNRKVFAFNVAVDKVLIRPMAFLYHRVTPSPLEKGFANALRNLNEPNHVINDLLQGELAWALNDFWRFVVNSVFGLGGLFDVAKHQGLPYHQQDLGLTMAKWGWRQSRFLMLPFLGATTLRDGLFSMPLDYTYLSVYQTLPESTQWRILGLRTLDSRADLLPVDHIIDQAFDPYIFLRNAYLQRRQKAIDEMEFSSAFANMADH